MSISLATVKRRCRIVFDVLASHTTVMISCCSRNLAETEATSSGDMLACVHVGTRLTSSFAAMTVEDAEFAVAAAAVA